MDTGYLDRWFFRRCLIELKKNKGEIGEQLSEHWNYYLCANFVSSYDRYLFSDSTMKVDSSFMDEKYLTLNQV
jgi:hypothetical protein